MIAIIDYDAGNLKSVENALQHLGQKCLVTRDSREILQADRVILPGVGAFGDAMEKLHRFGLVDVIHQVTDQGTPFLGICLGLQLLFHSSQESPGVEGLGILDGEIVAIPPKEGFKIPHMGWNSIHTSKDARLFRGIDQDSYVYFVHSFYLKANHPEDVAAVTDYIVPIHASVERKNVFACQFHPEKSGDIGMKILQNFCSC
jgi:glutamine amidotransferase